MEISFTNMASLILFGFWMSCFPKHLVYLIIKYQLFLFRYFPPARFVYKSAKDAEEPVFNERAVRALGYASFIGAIVIATKLAE